VLDLSSRLEKLSLRNLVHERYNRAAWLQVGTQAGERSAEGFPAGVVGPSDKAGRARHLAVS